MQHIIDDPFATAVDNLREELLKLIQMSIKRSPHMFKRQKIVKQMTRPWEENSQFREFLVQLIYKCQHPHMLVSPKQKHI